MFNFKKANWDELNNKLRHINWDQMLKYCAANTAWLRFKTKLLELCNIYIPTITIKSDFQPPWFDSETFKLCRKKDRLRAKYKVSKDPVHYQQYSNCRKDLKILIEDKMRANLDNDEDDPALISKKFWSHVKATSNSSRIPESVSYNGRFRNNISDQTELFNQYFFDQFSEPSNYDIPINFLDDAGANFVVNHTEVRTLLKKLNPNKAQGPDGIHGKILKNCAVGIAYPLTLIFNTSYKMGLIPDEWKLAHVVPVHKKGSKASVENYRPISLTCLSMKIFEKIIRDKIMYICQDKINQKQHGFLPGKSCATQMVPFYDSLAVTINDLSSTDVIYFDFAKAFDSVNHDIILHKLKHQFHIDGLLLKFLTNYLQDRKQSVVIGGNRSNVLPVISGVPQGSILGPLLFVLFINDLPDCISPGTNIALYADDTKIWRKISRHEDQIILQKDIDSLYAWSVLNKMKYHPHKCKVLSVSSLNRPVPILPFDKFMYCMDNICIDYVESEKDLGVHITTRLNWKEHIFYLCSKANRMLGLVKRSCNFVKDASQKRVLYLSLVGSQFNHCSSIWRPSSITLLNKIERVQVRAIKWILSEQHAAYSTIKYFTKCKELKLLPLKVRMDFLAILTFHKIIHKTIPIKLPYYITLAPQTNLRYSHTDPLTFKSLIKPRIAKTNAKNIITIGKNKKKCRLPKNKTLKISNKKASVKVLKKAYKKSNKFFKKRRKVDIIYHGTNKNIDDFSENKVFTNSYFYKTHIHWNNLPLELKIIENYNIFKDKLENYMWDCILDFNDQGDPDSGDTSLGLPGD